MIEQFEEERVDELTESIVLLYLNKKGQDPRDIICVDIEGIIKELYDCTIRYENITETKPGIVGFSANGKRPLCVSRQGKFESIIFPENTIVLEKVLKLQRNSAQRRFVMAHELGHKIYAKVVPQHSQGNYNMIFDKEFHYTFEQLKEQLNIEEIEATKFGCSLLMPRFLLVNTIHRIFGTEKIRVFGEMQILPDDMLKIKQMTDDLGVTFNMLIRALKAKKLTENCDINEYLAIVGVAGGENLSNV